MAQRERAWPPLILNGKMSRWVLVRDAFLTVLMWLMFWLLISGDLDRVAGHWLDELGLRPQFQRAGYKNIATSWQYYLYVLAPYFGIALLLTITLVSFAIGTLNRHARAVRGRWPAPLPLAIEARNAEFSTHAEQPRELVEVGSSASAEVGTIEARTLPAIVGKFGEAALIDARRLKVAKVHVSGSGRYQIEREE